MKQLAVIAAAVVVFASACSTASHSSGSKAKIEDPVVNVEQLHGPAQENYPEGPIEVQYELQIGNKSDVPMTLKRVQIRTVNPAGGAYSIPNRAYYMNVTIPPHSDGSATFWAKGYFFGRGPRESEPVTLQGTAYFDTPRGYYDKVFVADISQYQ